MTTNSSPESGFARTLARLAWFAWAVFVFIWASVSTVAWLSTGDLGSFIGGGIVVALMAVIPAGLMLVAADLDGPKPR